MNPYVGNDFQIRGAESYVLRGGKQEGMRMLRLKNGLGLEIVISLDRGGDILYATYLGRNVSYITANGPVHPSYYDDKGAGWLKTFSGGLFVTCGFQNVGSPCQDENGEYPLHGSISCIPVFEHSIEEKEDGISVRMVVNDESVFGRKFQRIRVIRLSYAENAVELHDEIENRGDARSHLMVLYHCNLGYPLLQEDSELEIRSSAVAPRNARAAEGIREWMKMEKPTPQFEEQCYYHTMKEGYASLYSPKENIGLRILFDPKNLPAFTEWKMMGVRDYVLGLEPGNVNADGYVENRRKGLIDDLEPGEKRFYNVRFEFYQR